MSKDAIKVPEEKRPHKLTFEDGDGGAAAAAAAGLNDGRRGRSGGVMVRCCR